MPVPVSARRETRIMMMQGLWERMTGQSKDVEALLSALYSDPSRKYHNLQHVQDCLRELEDLKAHSLLFLPDSDVDEITIAVWFHDAIYDPKAHNNEEESALLFEQLSEGMDPAACERIRGMILSTKNHRSSCNSLQEHVMLDLDLSILGKAESEFDEYDRAIRMEYGWVPEAVYRDKRAAVLATFLERERIYNTDYFHKKYDRSCRSNLKRAIACLRSTSPSPSLTQP